MLIRFSSVATESVTMFGDVATQLISMLGASGSIPGAISAEDIPAAIQRLRQQLQVRTASSEPSSERSDRDDDDKHQTSISLDTRAGPLLAILERASGADAPVMWEKA